MTEELNLKEALFVAEYVSTGDMVGSYRHAYTTSKLPLRTVAQRAESVMNRPRVAKAIEAGRRVLGDKLIFDVKDVFLEWMDIATADPNEIISLRKECCRFCYGIDHRYQWTDAEYADKCDEYLRVWGPEKEPPQAPGGFGFDLTRPPNPECPECRGRGVANVVNHDTTKLSRKARKLYAGIKWTKHGPEVLLRDQDAALNNIAKSLGMFVERIKLEATVHERLNKPLPTDPVAASRAYMDLITNDN